ncbi:type II toxin-antitoxin system mRNA interferase toxin, RelE/StbE family [Candidatus Saccharibacteria bacterium]|nr:type II toxin-antitoxin system mRNA interferase toxin, RelE/StbE family [Candidatus Saccharibacteria bacterium]
MKANFHKTFNKQFEKLQEAQRKQIKEAITLFLTDPNHHSLRNHPLKGEWRGYRSMSAGGDLRLHYRIIDDQNVLFIAVGSHSQLYK